MEQTQGGEHKVEFSEEKRIALFTYREALELHPQKITIPFAVLKVYVAQILTREAEGEGGLSAITKGFIATFLEHEAAEEMGVPSRDSPDESASGPKLVG